MVQGFGLYWLPSHLFRACTRVRPQRIRIRCAAAEATPQPRAPAPRWACRASASTTGCGAAARAYPMSAFVDSSVALAAVRHYIAGRDAAGIFQPDVTVALFVLDQLHRRPSAGYFHGIPPGADHPSCPVGSRPQWRSSGRSRGCDGSAPRTTSCLRRVGVGRPGSPLKRPLRPMSAAPAPARPIRSSGPRLKLSPTCH